MDSTVSQIIAAVIALLGMAAIVVAAYIVLRSGYVVRLLSRMGDQPGGTRAAIAAAGGAALFLLSLATGRFLIGLGGVALWSRALFVGVVFAVGFLFAARVMQREGQRSLDDG